MNSGFIDQVISIFNQSVVNKLMTLYIPRFKIGLSLQRSETVIYKNFNL